MSACAHRPRTLGELPEPNTLLLFRSKVAGTRHSLRRIRASAGMEAQDTLSTPQHNEALVIQGFKFVRIIGRSVLPMFIRGVQYKRLRSVRPPPELCEQFRAGSVIINRTVHEVSLRHVRLVRVHVDKLPCSQNRCGKQNGEFSFLGHAELLHCGMKFRREKRERQFIFYRPTSP